MSNSNIKPSKGSLSIVYNGLKWVGGIGAITAVGLSISYLAYSFEKDGREKELDIQRQWQAIEAKYPGGPGKEFLESIGYKYVNGGDALYENCQNGRITRRYNAQHENDNSGKFKTVKVCLGDNPPRLLYNQ